MGWNKPDCYNQPEAFGLTIIEEIQDADASYSFDQIVLWRHEDGRLFYGGDAGCSCPTPFEDFTSLDCPLMHLLTNETWTEFEKFVMEWQPPYMQLVRHTDMENALQRAEMLRAGALALAGKM